MAEEVKKIKNFEYLVPILIIIIAFLILIKTGWIKEIPVIGDFFKGTTNILVIGNKNDETTAIVQTWLDQLKVSYPINYYVVDPNKLADLSKPIYDKYDIIILAGQEPYPRELLNALKTYDKNIIVIGMAGERVKGEPDVKGWGLMGFNVVQCEDPLCVVCNTTDAYLGDLYIGGSTDTNHPIVKELTGSEILTTVPLCDPKVEDCDKLVKIYNVNAYDNAVKEVIKFIIKVGNTENPKTVLFEKDGINGKQFYLAYIDDDNKTHLIFDNIIKYIMGYI